MSRCAAKVGFFSLRDCGAPAAVRCDACMRWVCPQHVAGGEGTVCAECAARRREGEYVNDEWSRERVYSVRDGYYRSYHYRPFYYGYYADDYYDDYDLRGFDRDAAEPLELGDEAESDFFDS